NADAWAGGRSHAGAAESVRAIDAVVDVVVGIRPEVVIGVRPEHIVEEVVIGVRPEHWSDPADGETAPPPRPSRPEEAAAEAGKPEVRAERGVGDGAIAEYHATQVHRAYRRPRECPRRGGRKTAAGPPRHRPAGTLARKGGSGETATRERTDSAAGTDGAGSQSYAAARKSHSADAPTEAADVAAESSDPGGAEAAETPNAAAAEAAEVAAQSSDPDGAEAAETSNAAAAEAADVATAA